MVRRRRLLQCAAATAAFVALAGCAPAPRRAARVGYIAGFTDPATDPLIDGVRQGLHELGYIEGSTLQFELRYGEGDVAKYDAFARELVGLPVDVFVTSNTDAFAAMRRATTTIPIVVASSSDPVESGLSGIESLAHPGGQVTGMAVQSSGLTAKSLDLLKEAFPSLRRVALLWDAEKGRLPSVQAAEAAAARLGLDPVVLDVPAQPDPAAAMARALDSAGSRAVDSLHVLRSNIHVIQLRKQILGFAAARRIPAVYPTLGGYWQDGGLLAFGPDDVDTFRRSATFIDRILKGAKPGDLPMEQPEKFALVVNLRTAQDLGLSIPNSVVERATRVIR